MSLNIKKLEMLFTIEQFKVREKNSNFTVEILNRNFQCPSPTVHADDASVHRSAQRVFSRYFSAKNTILRLSTIRQAVHEGGLSNSNRFESGLDLKRFEKIHIYSIKTREVRTGKKKKMVSSRRRETEEADDKERECNKNDGGSIDKRDR